MVDCGATCDTAEKAAIYAAASGSGVLTDAAVAGDAVSFAALTVDAGDQNVAGNDQLDIAANTVLALVFTVTVQ